MVNAQNVLVNDWAAVKIFCDVVAGCADEFYTSLVGLMVRPGSREGR